MARDAEKDFSEGGLHPRETASRIEQKFAAPNGDSGAQTKKKEKRPLTRRKVKRAHKIAVEAAPVDVGEQGVVIEVLPVWLRIVALTIQEGIASGALVRDAGGRLQRSNKNS